MCVYYVSLLCIYKTRMHVYIKENMLYVYIKYEYLYII